MIARRHFIFPINLLWPRGESLSFLFFSFLFFLPFPRFLSSLFSSPLFIRQSPRTVPFVRTHIMNERTNREWKEGESAKGIEAVRDPETKPGTVWKKEDRENDKRISRNTVDLVASPVELKGLDSLTRWLVDKIWSLPDQHLFLSICCFENCEILCIEIVYGLSLARWFKNGKD